jgi:hypothetical protein
MEFWEWYESLTRADKGALLSGKRDRKQSWDSFFVECHREYLVEEAEYNDYQEELAYMRRNRNEYG